ncbi:hypothetical protein OIU80_11725 [Flavobacterium sp. LS1R47]|uniref:Uncharacterized protein n=1 Tax=Flavobacterium frigoritolerans TaxID=2987686 RepID=A0A9X3C1A7_9FLAO|nr:hypothetical protein [Flavobacterium frigoritolerans]MCV9932950.1 hypothetical protein [Flavobacterium frigoritolerans]
MTTIFRIKKQWSITFCMLLFSSVSFAQELNDREMDFDATKIIFSLKERILTPAQTEEAIKLYKSSLVIKATQLENIRQEQALKYFPNEDKNDAKDSTEKSENKRILLDVPVEERNALIAFYNATQEDGAWYHSNNWNTSKPVESWYGVTVVNNHVTLLNLRANNLKGQIPDISALKNYLTAIRIGGNKLYGSLENLGKLTSLNSIDISYSLFDGNLEPIGNLINLESFSAYSNKIKGQIPDNFSNLSKLKYLQISNNNLSGAISSIGINLPALEYLNLTNNNFTNNGTLPNSFLNLKKLKSLICNSAGLSENLEILGNLTDLEHLDLGNNKFSGPLPQNFQNLTKLKFFAMHDNDIDDISVLSSLNSLESIWFGNNQIKTNLSSFSNLINLNVLSLPFNKITGEIPVAFQDFQNIDIISLSYNKLTGLIPRLTFTNDTYGEKFSITGNNFRFIDFVDTYDYYYSTIGYNYSYYPQSATDTMLTYSKSEGEVVNLEMYSDNRYLPNDTFQWYKDEKKIFGATNRVYTINSFNSANDKGEYYCLSSNPMNPYFFLSRNKIYLNSANCPEIKGEISTTNNEKIYVNKISNFIFKTTATNLKYDWKIYTLDNYLLDHKKEQIFTTLIKYNNCKIELIVTDINGCKTSFIKEFKNYDACSEMGNHSGYIKPSNYENICVGDKITYTYYKHYPEKVLSYKWHLYDKNLVLISTSNESEFTVSHNSLGENSIKLYLTDENGCTTEVTRYARMVICNSCTIANEKSEIVKGAVINLLKSLAVKVARGDTDAQINGSNPSELIALKEYLMSSVADKIYNFVSTRNDSGEITSLQFSFSQDREYDIYYVNSYGLNYYFDFDISQYIGYNELLISCQAMNTRMINTRGLGTELYNKIGCDTGMSIQYVDFCPEKTVEKKDCAKEPISFVFETISTNLNYTWTSTNALGVIVHTETNTTGLYTFTPELAGEYEIKLMAEGAVNCETLFSKTINIENCLPFVSCTKSNIHAPEIQRLFISLITKLVSTPNGTDANTYAKKEIAALSPYTTASSVKIYNFSNTSTAISFSFSKTAIGNDVQLPKSLSGTITDIDLRKYTAALAKNTVAINYSDGTTNSNGYVQNIDFCPNELSCVSHIALVVDESGSIDSKEANKIKKQLKLFIKQQALTNDSIGSNIYVSLTGMSDSDENTRTDFILPTKLTNTPASLRQFNVWIDSFGKRNGKTGISASSDYWRSGLEGALGYSMKPNMVIMITDGCQTANVDSLKITMKKFNNAYGSDPKLPHLYIVGIENGIYVDETFYTNKFLSPTADPNNSQNNLVNTVTNHLTKSLKYLLDFPATEFPKSDINEFGTGTYYGHDNFNLLSSDETYFSDKLADSKIVCGTASIKDFCDDCLSFKPEPGKEYMLSAWVKEELSTQVKTYENPAIKIIFYNRKEALDIPTHKIDSLSVKASGNIIDGWQRVVQKFKVPVETITIGIQLENNSPSIPVYFDDIRIHPLQGSVKSFVYDPETFKLMSELDENNYSTFYEYDNEGGLVRVKKETEKGIKTIQETRSGSVINTKL